MLHVVGKRRIPLPGHDDFGIPKDTPFKAYTKKIKNAHQLQFTLDYEFEPGLWVKMGINQTLYVAGYFPVKEKTA